MAHEGVPLVVIQRQLGHADLRITSIYLQGIDSSEIISTVHGRPSPTISATAGLQMTRDQSATGSADPRRSTPTTHPGGDKRDSCEVRADTCVRVFTRVFVADGSERRVANGIGLSPILRSAGLGR